jgi:threonyl-tRNA synthetase
LAQYNFILVIGDEEEKEGTVNVRIRDEKQERGKISLEDLIVEFKGLIKEYK